MEEDKWKRKEKRGGKMEETGREIIISSVMPAPQEGWMCPIVSGHGVVGFPRGTRRNPCGEMDWPVGQNIRPQSTNY